MIKLFETLKKKQINKRREESRNKIIEEIKNICFEMDQTNNWFQMENDNDLIDACIHQREVLSAKYRYFMNKIRLNKIS